MARFEDILGHEQARLALQRALDTDRTPRGLLFHGAPGRARLALALALASKLICEEGDLRCHLQMEAREHPDLFLAQREPEQRQIVIQKIRELREWFSLRPSSSSRRVAIIHEADRLTQEAGNALLKTLEEPPSYAHVILIARDRDSVMETLLSRCRVMALGPLSVPEIESFLSGRGVPPADRALLALIANGCSGWALEAYEDGLKDLLGEVELILRSGTRPFEISKTLVTTAKKGRKLEGARELLTKRLKVAMTFLRLERSHRLLGKAAPEAFSACPAIRDFLARIPDNQLDWRLEAYAQALKDLQSNAVIELVLEGLGVRLASARSGFHGEGNPDM